MEDGIESETWAGYVDWRNRPALRGKHGGMLAASFVLVVEVMENLAYLANASNLVTYLSRFMHMSPARSANTVTNFMGTAFLLALLGGFFCDAFFTTYIVYLISSLVQFMGLVILTVQAMSPALMPPECTDPALPCEEVSGADAAMLFAGLYLVALGVGGIKGSLPAHGADQFDDGTMEGRRRRSTFFNYYVFCLSCGGLIAVTFVVWLEDNKGWKWGFGVSTAAILLSIPVFLAGSPLYRSKMPTSSPLTTIAKVMAAALLSRSYPIIHMDTSSTTKPFQTKEDDDDDDDEEEPKKKEKSKETPPPPPPPPPTQNQTSRGPLSFLNRAAQAKPIHPSLACTVSEVDDAKVVLGTLPIFLSTIILNACLAQLSTFSVQQVATMDTTIGRLTVPPASLPIFPVVFILVLAPIYDHAIVPFARRITRSEMGISHLQRIGAGLVLSVVAMAVAAAVEGKRRAVAADGSDRKPLPMTFLWVALQYLFLGSADLFTLAGLLEFFFTEAPARMRSLATSLSWASLAIGYYLSSVLVDLVNTASGGGEWLAGRDLNQYRLDKFYWLLCVLSALNFLQYLFWAARYEYKSQGSLGERLSSV